MIDILFH